MSQPYTIATLAQAAGVNLETVRYYQRRGLMPEPARPLAGYRHYGASDLDRLRFIKRAQVVGFTLTEIQTLLKLRARKSCRATHDLAVSKLEVVDTRIRELRQLRRELVQWIAECEANTEDAVCPAIERLDVPSS